MQVEGPSFEVVFSNSKQKVIIPLSELEDCVLHFLEFYGTMSVVGRDFFQIVGEGDGKSKLQRLLTAAGHADDTHGFFDRMLRILEATHSDDIREVRINDVVLPYLMVNAVMKLLIPGEKLTTVKTIQKLERLANITIAEEEREDLQRVLDVYPVQLSNHTIRQARFSRAIAYQYIPFPGEMDARGFVHTWVGQFHRGILEQMYQNRVILVLNMTCPVYCRFCFRKHKECRNQKAPTQTHVKEATDYIAASQDIKEVVLTGGDPFMNRTTLTYALDRLEEAPNIQTLRIATRSISYYPQMFFNKDSFWLKYLKRMQLTLSQKGKRLEVATHFIHPDEISIEALDIISALTYSGIAVYVQTPLLADCNDEGPELKTLFSKLRFAGAEMHYIYIPCSTIKGNHRYVAPLSRGHAVASYLRAHLTDRAIPRICTATKFGKIDWNTSGWAVKRDENDSRYIWIRTPYTQDYFSQFAPIIQMADFAEVNAEGTLNVKFMADIGDEKLFWGERKPISIVPSAPTQENEDASWSKEDQSEMIPFLKQDAVAVQMHGQTIVPTSCNGLFRPHETRVELDISGPVEDIEQAIAYIEANAAVTDIVLSSNSDAVESIYQLKQVMGRLVQLAQVTAYRLRSLKFNYAGEVFTHATIQALGKLNDLSIQNPSRLEIETQFLLADEITAKHGEVAARLKDKGITVYNNTPLLPGINDTKEEMLAIAYNCRKWGIEFHHLYVAGLPQQEQWMQNHAVNISTIIDMATYLRRLGSGREIPRFIIRTLLGEVDFNLTSRVVDTDEENNVYLKLLPYTLAYFRNIDPEYGWPSGTTVDDDGHPIVFVQGLKSN